MPRNTNSGCINEQVANVDEHSEQSTLREWTEHMGHKTTLTILAAVCLILAIIGPFGTGEMQSFGPALGYWTAIVFGSYGLGTLFNQVLKDSIPVRNKTVCLCIIGVLIGIPTTFWVAALNKIALGASAPDMRGIAASIVIISVIVNLLLGHFLPEQETARTDLPVIEAPAILDRIPLEKRGKLVALHVEDHYVRVITEHGEEMILMRLADAIRETTPSVGDQVHRSYWAAWDQVASVKKKSTSAILTMKTGHEIPVSRSNLSKLKEAGLLPR